MRRTPLSSCIGCIAIALRDTSRLSRRVWCVYPVVCIFFVVSNVVAVPPRTKPTEGKRQEGRKVVPVEHSWERQWRESTRVGGGFSAPARLCWGEPTTASVLYPLEPSVWNVDTRLPLSPPDRDPGATRLRCARLTVSRLAAPLVRQALTPLQSVPGGRRSSSRVKIPQQAFRN